jgi:phage shock protein C
VEREVASSREQLDEMLEAGRISEEEYDTLRAAMERKRETAPAPEPPSAAGTLRRSTRNLVIAGVCGGIAESTGMNPWLIRLLAMLLLLFSGGAAIVAYVVFAFAVPASETDGVPRPDAGLGGIPWAFAPVAVSVWMANTVYSLFILPRFMEIWDEMGAKLPGLTQLVVTLCNSILCRSLLGLMLQAGILTLLVVVYALLPRRSPARVALWVVLLLTAAVWGSIVLLALYLPYIRVDGIR